MSVRSGTGVWPFTSSSNVGNLRQELEDAYQKLGHLRQQLKTAQEERREARQAILFRDRKDYAVGLHYFDTLVEVRKALRERNVQTDDSATRKTDKDIIAMMDESQDTAPEWNGGGVWEPTLIEVRKALREWNDQTDDSAKRKIAEDIIAMIDESQDKAPVWKGEDTWEPGSSTVSAGQNPPGRAT